MCGLEPFGCQYDYGISIAFNISYLLKCEMGKSKTCNGTKRNEIKTKRNETKRNETKLCRFLF
jgi:hypothetical protein